MGISTHINWETVKLQTPPGIPGQGLLPIVAGPQQMVLLGPAKAKGRTKTGTHTLTSWEAVVVHCSGGAQTGPQIVSPVAVKPPPIRQTFIGNRHSRLLMLPGNPPRLSQHRH